MYIHVLCFWQRRALAPNTPVNFSPFSPFSGSSSGWCHAARSGQTHRTGASHQSPGSGSAPARQSPQHTQHRTAGRKRAVGKRKKKIETGRQKSSLPLHLQDLAASRRVLYPQPQRGSERSEILGCLCADSKHCLPTILLQQHPAPHLHPFEDRETKAMVSLNCCDCVGITGASVIPLPVPVPLPVSYVSPSLLACFLTLYVSACLFLRVSSITIIFLSLFVPVPSHSFLPQFPKVTNPF